MRVVELSQRYPPALGGVEATLEQLVARLRENGVEVDVVTTDLSRNHPFTRLPALPTDRDAGIHRCRAFRTLPLPLGLGIVAPGMVTALDRMDADLIHAHAFGYFPTFVGAWIRKRHAVPLVVTTHVDPGRGMAFSGLYHRFVARETLRRADRVIVQSIAEREFLTRLGVDPAFVVRIPTGIALEEFVPSTSPSTSFRILYVGRIDREQKGIPTLIRALARLPKSLDWTVRLVGDDWGGSEPARALAADLGIDRRLSVEVAPPRPRVLAAFRDADLFVLPSRFESFPRVLLEAMASGLPIVATRVGGVAESVVEGENALLVPPDDPAMLAASILRIASDGPLRSRFAAASRRRAETFSWSNLIPRYLELFREVVERPRSVLARDAP